MARIFISYRRTDAGGYAGRLYDRLSSHFGADHTFIDVDLDGFPIVLHRILELTAIAIEVPQVMLGGGKIRRIKQGLSIILQNLVEFEARRTAQTIFGQCRQRLGRLDPDGLHVVV